MSIARCFRPWAAGIWAALATACASAPSGVELPHGTLVLGEVRHVLTRAMVDANEFAPGDIREGLGARLLEAGFTEAQIDAGRVVVERSRIYWNNTVSGAKYSVHKPALVAEGLVVAPGNVVEIEVADRPSSIVRRVRATSLAEGGCYYGDVAVGTAVEVLGALSLVGPRGSASLYCAGIENEGWQRPRTYWHKLPGAPVPLPDAPREAPPPPIPAEAVPAATPVDAAGDLAVVMVQLSPNRLERPYFARLPVWIDGTKVAELDQGACEIVLVPAGAHLVVAGNADRGLLRAHARRELALTLHAGDKIVLDYAVDNQALVESERSMFAMFEIDKWEPRIYSFAQRPATARDTCAIRHPPQVLGR